LRLENLWRLKLPDTAWHGFVDVTLDGMIHFHGVIWHPERTKDALGNTLRKAFIKKNAIMIKPWGKGKTLLANMEGVLQYALPTDRHVPRRKYGRRKGEAIVDERTGERIVKRMVALQHMCQRGVQGIRLSFNMRTTCVWKAGVLFDKETGETIIIPEMEARILARRRRGRNGIARIDLCCPHVGVQRRNYSLHVGNNWKASMGTGTRQWTITTSPTPGIVTDRASIRTGPSRSVARCRSWHGTARAGWSRHWLGRLAGVVADRRRVER
jgi:hypothetical protein